MGHNRGTARPAQESKGAVGVAIIPGGGAQLPHPGDLTPALRQVGLDGQTVLPLKPAQLFHQRIGAGGDEAGRQNGPCAAVAAFDPLQPSFGALNRRGGGGLPERLRAAAVHIDLSHHGAQAGFLQQIHQPDGGLRVDGGEHAGPGIRSPPDILHKALVSLTGIVQAGVFALLRKCVPVQPVQQLQVHPLAARGVLGRVDVQVRQPRHHQGAAAVQNRQACVLLRQRLKYPGGTPFKADQPAAGIEPQRLWRRTVADIRSDYKGIMPHTIASLLFFISCLINGPLPASGGERA